MFAVWRDEGAFERINHALVMADRERVGKRRQPTAALIDKPEAQTTEAGGPRGGSDVERSSGAKRHALETDEARLVLETEPASIQGALEGGPIMRRLRRSAR